MKFIKLFESYIEESKYSGKEAWSIEGDVYLTMGGPGVAMKMRNKKYPDRKPLKHVTDVPVSELGKFSTDGTIFYKRPWDSAQKYAKTLPDHIEIKNF